MAARNDERKTKASNNSRQAEKIGYVPRNKQAASMAASGLTSAGMMGKGGRGDPDQVKTNHCDNIQSATMAALNFPGRITEYHSKIFLTLCLLRTHFMSLRHSTRTVLLAWHGCVRRTLKSMRVSTLSPGPSTTCHPSARL